MPDSMPLVRCVITVERHSPNQVLRVRLALLIFLGTHKGGPQFRELPLCHLPFRGPGHHLRVASK